MIYLNQICFLKNVLKETKNNFISDEKSQMARLYTDASIALAELVGFDEEKKEISFDDGETYPLSSFAINIIKKQSKEHSQTIHSNKEITTSEPPVIAQEPVPESAPEPAMTEDANSQEQTDVVSSPVSPASVPSTEETQMVLSKHQMRLSNKKNPSDVKEFSFVVSPLSVADDVATTDIAVIVSHNGQELYFVSPKVGPKSIRCEIGGMQFIIRGTWKNRKFNSVIYPSKANEFDCKDNQAFILPENLIAENFRKEFVMSILDTSLYVLPQAKMNEPSSGLCSICVVQEDEESRQVYVNQENVHFLYIGGIKYRVYAKWEQNNLSICVEQMDM